ncbi:hypothetical protein DV735_g1935, partial [Chaetothyriales sp. CBS 134920]
MADREDLGYVWAPGTVAISEAQPSGFAIIRQPKPTNDPNDPLNWSWRRKVVNYGLVSYYVLWTFVALDIGFTAWGPMIEELGLSIDGLNAAAAVNYAGLGFGCIFFIPFVHKYGRRPLYIISVLTQLLSCVWQAEVHNQGNLVGANILSGVGGAISETIVQITIADVFFVHHHATMNAFYLLFTMAGAFLGPVASGFVVVDQGWRWIWWWCVIFIGINLVAVIFFYEETKYVPALEGHTETSHSEDITNETVAVFRRNSAQAVSDNPKHDEPHEVARQHSLINSDIRLKSYRERMALWTPTPGKIMHHFYQPIIVLFTFPAVSYTALTYGGTLATFAIMTSVQATYMIIPPYNFSAVGIGLMNIPPFIGCIIGFFVGYLNDASILRLAKRNGGVFEPEMRLWLALPSIILLPAGILMFGIGLAKGVAWPLLAVGYGVWGVGFSVAADISLAYCTDCYQDIVGDSLVGIVFSRNLFSVVVLFTITPWINGMGIQNLHILTASVMFVILCIPVALLKYGKAARLWTRNRYSRYALRQPTSRTF